MPLKFDTNMNPIPEKIEQQVVESSQANIGERLMDAAVDALVKMRPNLANSANGRLDLCVALMMAQLPMAFINYETSALQCDELTPLFFSEAVARLLRAALPLADADGTPRT